MKKLLQQLFLISILGNFSIQATQFEFVPIIPTYRNNEKMIFSKKALEPLHELQFLLYTMLHNEVYDLDPQNINSKINNPSSEESQFRELVIFCLTTLTQKIKQQNTQINFKLFLKENFQSNDVDSFLKTITQYSSYIRKNTTESIVKIGPNILVFLHAIHYVTQFPNSKALQISKLIVETVNNYRLFSPISNHCESNFDIQIMNNFINEFEQIQNSSIAIQARQIFSQFFINTNGSIIAISSNLTNSKSRPKLKKPVNIQLNEFYTQLLNEYRESQDSEILKLMNIIATSSAAMKVFSQNTLKHSSESLIIISVIQGMIDKMNAKILQITDFFALLTAYYDIFKVLTLFSIIYLLIKDTLRDLDKI